MPTPTVRDIVIEYLKANDYDGLVNPGIPCGCEMDDICPYEWENNFADCQSAYKCKPTEEDIKEFDLNPDNPGNWMMKTLKEGRIADADPE